MTLSSPSEIRGFLFSGRLRFLVQDGVDQHGAVRLRERTLAGGEFIQHGAEGPDVGAAVGGFAAQLLGGHVGQRPGDLLRTGQACRDRRDRLRG